MIKVAIPKTEQKRVYTKSRLQEDCNGTYKISIPRQFIEKNLKAFKGDIIEFDYYGEQVILTKSKKQVAKRIQKNK